MIPVYKYQTVEAGAYTWKEKVFKSQKELFAYLVKEKDLILSQKKSIIKHAHGSLSATFAEGPADFATKGAVKPVYENDKQAGVLKRTIVANTYWWMDSHSDVHLSGIFSDTIKGRAHKIFPIDQHNWSLDGRMGKTLNLYEAPISWRALGIGKTGMTEALIADAQIEKERNERRYKDYLNDEIDQHSVGMQYIDIELAVNDEHDYPKEYQVYQKYIDKIGNRSRVEEQGFFFAVGKARLLEYSAVVAGSNELTPTLNEKKKISQEAIQSKRLLEALKNLSTTLK